MKRLVLIIFISFKSLLTLAQTEDSNSQSIADTGILPSATTTLKKPAPEKVVTDTARKRNLPVKLRVADSLPKPDSFIANPASTFRPIKKDSVKVSVASPVVKRPIDSFYLKLLNNPFFKATGKPLYLIVNERKREYKDEAFYLLSGLLLFLAFIKLIFSRYFRNIFLLFFQPSFRQKQTREQLQQSKLPSLLLNLFFVFSCGAYISFLLTYYKLTSLGFWLILLYSTLSLLVLYLGKFIFLSFAGWVFNVKDAAGSYIFSVYLINKIIGVVLLPFTLIIAFSKPAIINVSITISILIIALLFIYRYFVSYAPVRREVKVNVLHFFFYISAFEITPLLLIYKTLIIYLNKSL